MARWWRVWAVLIGSHYVGSVLVRWVTGAGLEPGQDISALLVVPVAELAALAIMVRLGGPSPS